MAEAILRLPRTRIGRTLRLFGRARGVDLLLGAAILGAAWGIARDYLHPSLLIWGDHPGQFMRMWYPLAQSLPHRAWVVDWNPTWYAGYPELQFYPPGMVLIGLLLHLLTLGLLPPEQLYNLIPALAFVLPLFTCFVFLRAALAPLGRWPSRLAGVSAGLLTVSFAPMWGGIDAVVIGLMGERLAFGTAPLALLAGWKVVERPSRGRMAAAALALAALLLLHPFHAPAVVLAVGLYALIRSRMRTVQQIVLPAALAQWLGGWLLLTLGLTCWWLMPLLLRYTPYAASLVRAQPDQVVSWFDAGPVPHLWLAALPALLLLYHPRARVRGTVAALALLIPLILGGILVNDRLLLGRLGWSMFDPIRFIAEYYLALILLVGCAVGAATSHFLRRIPPATLTALLLLAVALQPITPRLWRDLQSHRAVPDHFRAVGLADAPLFAGFWQALRDDPGDGRVLFLSNYLKLAWSDDEILPTTLYSLTPYLTGREIVGGTFSHWSPVARQLWTGDAWARLLPAQMEAEDDRRLFGIPWEEMDDADLAARLQALNITTLVAGPANPRAQARLDSSPRFQRTWSNGSFTLYHLTAAAGDSGGWVNADGAEARLVERSPRRWRIAVDEQTPGATLTLKIAHYPLWRAQAAGRMLPIASTPDGLQQIALPGGAPYTLEVAYQEGWAERLGAALSVASLLLTVALLWPARVARRYRFAKWE
jgi:hypothetical protein